MQTTFEQAGFDRTRIDQLTGDGPLLSDDWEHDTATSSAFWQNAQSMLDQLPPKPRRSQAETEAAAAILALTTCNCEFSSQQ